MIEILNKIIFIIFIIGIISLILLIILRIIYQLNKYEKANVLNYFKENIYFRTSVLLTIISFILIPFLTSYVTQLIREEIKKKFEKTTNKNIILTINDTIKKNDSLITAIKNIGKTTNERNTGSLEINVKLENEKETIYLILLRDFNTQNKYWVNYKNYKVPFQNYIGEINTASLNDYK